MDGFIDNYLKDLTKTLDEAFDFVISKDLVGNNQELFDYVKNFAERLKSEEVDIMKCDFKMLRRKINKLIHPDLNQKFKTEANKFVTKINSSIDNILEFQKSMIQRQIESYNWSTKSSQRKYEFKSNFETPRKDKYKTYYSGDINKEKGQIYVSGYQTIGDSIKELWNYIVNKVPRDLNDYEKFKKAYENLIKKLKIKIQNKNEAIKTLELKIKELNLELKNRLTVESINSTFEEEKNIIKNEHNRIIGEYEKQSKILEEITEPLKPHIEKIVRERCKTMEKMYTYYKQIRSMVEKNPNLLKQNYPGANGTFADVLRNYETELNKYPNAKIIYEKTANDVYMQNRNYVKECKKLNLLEKDAREVYERMMPYFNNPEVVKIEIKNDIQNNYGKEISELENQKRLIEKKDGKLNIKLERIEAEYAKFLLTYENSYGRFQKRGGIR